MPQQRHPGEKRPAVPAGVASWGKTSRIARQICADTGTGSPRFGTENLVFTRERELFLFLFRLSLLPSGSLTSRVQRPLNLHRQRTSHRFGQSTAEPMLLASHLHNNLPRPISQRRVDARTGADTRVASACSVSRVDHGFSGLGRSDIHTFDVYSRQGLCCRSVFYERDTGRADCELREAPSAVPRRPEHSPEQKKGRESGNDNAKRGVHRHAGDEQGDYEQENNDFPEQSEGRQRANCELHCLTVDLFNVV